jgi:hypothetical protein
MSHTITTWTDDFGDVEVEIVIEYDFHAAEPDVNYPDALEFVGAVAKAADGSARWSDEIEEWAHAWLHGRGRDEAVEKARGSKR